MRSVSIGLAAMITCLTLAGVPAGAQSRTTNPLQRSERQTATSASLYAFKDTAGFPQEWHAHRRPVTDDGDSSAPPRPASRPNPKYDEEPPMRRTPRLHAGEERATTRTRTTARATPTLRRTATRTVPTFDPSLEPQERPGRARTPVRTTLGQRSRTNRTLQPSRPVAHQQLIPDDLRSSKSPYAFMDTVGFPEPYEPSTARTGSYTAPRSTGSATRRTTRSRSTVPPGYVEIQ